MQKSNISASTDIGMHSTNETVIRVLCVDDETNLLDTTKSILELQTSFEIETASSVDEALQKMREKEFDVVVSDYQMPIKCGLDFLKELRDSGNTIPFILFTGKGREEVAVEALNLGADRYFNKIGHPETVYGELAHGISQLASKKGVEKQLKRLSSVIEQSSNTIVILDKEETIVYANPTFLAFHEVRFEDIVGKNWQEIIPEGNPLRMEHQNILDTVVDQKKTWAKEICGIYDNGKIAWRRAKIFPIFDENKNVTHFVYNAEDIGEQKKNEQTIWDREERLRAIIASSPDAMIVTDMHGNVTDCNLQTMKLLGVSSRRELVGQDCYKFIAKEYLENVRLNVPNLVEQGAVNNVECKLLTKNGSKIDVEFSANTLRDAYGEPVGTVILARDVTERKKVADAIKESEEKYRSIVELSPDGIATANMKGVVTSVNKAFLDLTGFSEEEIVGKHFTKLGTLRAKDMPKYVKLLAAVVRGKKHLETEFVYKQKDGAERLGEAYLTLLEENGKKIGIQAILRDITEEKKIQQALQESEEKYRNIVELSPDGMISLDTGGIVTAVNRAILEQTGFAETDFLGKHFTQLEAVPSKTLSGLTKKITSFFNGQPPEIFELWYNCKDGKQLCAEATVGLLKQNNKDAGIQLVFRDVTERKKAEGVLARERDNFEKVTGNLSASLAMISKDYRILWANNYTKDHMGDVTGKTCYESFSGLHHVCPGCKAEEVFKTGKQAVREQIVHNPKLGTIILNITSMPIKDENGNVTEILELAVDITERKKTEEKHLESEKKFMELAELLPEVIFEYDLNGKLTYVNHEAYTRFGYSRKEFEKGINVFELVESESREKARKNFAKLLNGEKPGYKEFKLIRKDGTTFPAIITSTSKIQHNKIVGVRGVLVDITERQKTENDLRQSQFDLNRAQAVAKTGSWRLDIQHNMLLWSDETYRIFGVPKGTPMTYEAFLELVHPEDRVYVDQKWQEALLGEPYNIDHRITLNGKVKWIQEKAELELGENGVLLGGFGTAQDITEIKKMEQDLKDSEEKYHKQFEESLDAIVLADPDTGIIIDCNRAASHLFGKRKSEIVGKHQWILHPPQDNPNTFTQGFIEHSKSKNGLLIESKIIAKKGEIRDVIIKGHVIKLGKRKVVQGIFRDITEYQKIQANLLKERDTLEKVTGNLNTTLLIISKDYRILWANNYIKNIVGDITGKLCYSALNRLDHICPGCKVNESIETGKQAVFEMNVPNPEGQNLPEGQDLFLEITAIPIKDKKGNVTEILELAQDITEQQKAENKVNETLNKMEKINEKLSVIGKLTRHDTRNKLATIVNSTYLAKTQIDNKESALKHLENVDTTIDQIERILEFSRIYEILGTQEKTNVNVKTILDEAFMLASQSHEIKLVNECENLTVKADSLLRQVFYNLIENSAKHGEKVTQIKVNYKKEKTTLKIIYTDNGIGIPKNEKEKIFQEGYGKGTGYGLYLIKKICDEYSWTITENGELNKGAKFVITIPK